MIKVNENMLEAYDTQYKTAADAIVNLVEYHTEIDKILASGKWKGNHHDKCAEIVAGANEYLTTLKTDIGSLKSAILELVENTDDFVDTAASVKEIKE